MEDIIKRIINIEEKAQKIIEDTAQEEKNFEKNLQEKIDHLHQDILTRADAKIESLNSQEDSGDAQAESKLRALAEKSAAHMRGIYEQKKDEWVETIFQGIVGR